jgi:hypothetical protein
VQLDVVYRAWCVASVFHHAQARCVCVCVCCVVVLDGRYKFGTAHSGMSGVVGAGLRVAGKLCLV